MTAENPSFAKNISPVASADDSKASSSESASTPGPINRRFWQLKRSLFAFFAALSVLTVIALPFLNARYATHLLEKSHPAEALWHWEMALRFYPWWKEARVQACIAARQAGDFDRAWLHLSALEQEGTNLEGDGPLLWAMIRASRGDLALVEAKLIEIWNRNRLERSDIPGALAEGYLRMFRLPDALAITSEWLKADPTSIRAHVLRADAWYRARSPDNAVPALQEVIDLDPGQIESRFHLALALLDKARYDEGLEQLNLVANVWPDNTLVSCRQARSLFMLGREKQARTLIARQLARFPSDAKLISTLGQIDLLSGRNEEAATLFRQALALRPADYQSIYSLSQALGRLGQREESQKWAKEAEKIKIKLERLNEITSKEIAQKPLDPALHEELGLLYEATGQSLSARAWLESATRIDPRRDSAREALQRVRAKLAASSPDSLRDQE